MKVISLLVLSYLLCFGVSIPAVEWNWTGAASFAAQAHAQQDSGSSFSWGSRVAESAGLKKYDVEIEHIHLSLNVELSHRFAVNIAPCIEHDMGTFSIRAANLEMNIWEGDMETILASEIGRYFVPFGRFNYLAEVTTYPTISRPMVFASHDQDIIILTGYPHPLFMSQFADIGINLNGNKWFGSNQFWYAFWVGNGMYQEGNQGHSHGGTAMAADTSMKTMQMASLERVSRVADAGHDSGGTSLAPMGVYNGIMMSPADISWLQKTRFASDNNNNKAVGGRFVYAYGSTASAGVSYMRGTYDPQDLLAYSALGFDASLDFELPIGALHLSSEYVNAPIEFSAFNDTATKRINIDSYTISAWYVQAVYSFAKYWEVVGLYDLLRREGPVTVMIGAYKTLPQGSERETSFIRKISGGINFLPISSVKIKTEYAYYWFDRPTQRVQLEAVHRLSAALVLSF